MPRRPVPSKPGRGPTRSPRFIAQCLAESDTETDAAVAARHGLGKTTLQKWRVAAVDDPEIAAELERLRRAVESQWVGKQGLALGAAWDAVRDAAVKLSAIIRGPLDEGDIGVMETLTAVISKAGDTLGGIDYVQRRAGALHGHQDPEAGRDHRAGGPRDPSGAERGEVH